MILLIIKSWFFVQITEPWEQQEKLGKVFKNLIENIRKFQGKGGLVTLQNQCLGEERKNGQELNLCLWWLFDLKEIDFKSKNNSWKEKFNWAFNRLRA